MGGRPLDGVALADERVVDGDGDDNGVAHGRGGGLAIDG